MKSLFAAILSLLAAQAHAQALEADLDGNASALQASEMRPAPKKATVRPAAPQSADKTRTRRT
jgi:hypothetical protein